MNYRLLFLSFLVLTILAVFWQKRCNAKFEDNYYIEVRLIKSFIEMNEGIGDDIYMKSYTEDDTLITSDFIKINLSNRKKYFIYSETVDEDPNHDDIGRSKFCISPQNIESILDKNGFEVEVETREFYGKGAGKVAYSKFIYSVKKS